MITKLVDSNYNPNRKVIHMSIDIDHNAYGTVQCLFEYKIRDREDIALSKIFVKNLMIPDKELQELLLSLRNNQALFKAAKISLLKVITIMILVGEVKIL